MPPAGTIRRMDAEALLDASTQRRVTVVCAGPGWGKTLTVAGWLAARPDQAAATSWLTMHPQLDDSASFWEALISALRTVTDLPSNHPLNAVSATAGVSEEMLVPLLRAVDALPPGILLVLEDFHEASDPLVLQSVARLAEHASSVKLLIITRVPPAIRRQRLRLSGELTELGADELAFTGDDVIDLARLEAIACTPSDAARLIDRTEGWPVGVRLALMHAARSSDPADALANVVGTEQSLAEYLLAEVLDRNEPEVRRFLLLTSVVQPVSSELAAQMMPGAPAQHILESLEAHNEFVTALGPDRTWFRYHPLLRDMLVHSLRREDPAAFGNAHRAAARWWAEHGDPIDALYHASAAQDWELFTDIYTSAAGPALVGARRSALHAALTSVPQAALPESVGLALQRAGQELVEGHPRAVRVHVERAQRSIEAGMRADVPSRVMTELLTFAAYRFDGDARAVSAAANRALDLVDEAEPFPAAAAYRMIAQHGAAVGALWSGDLERADALFSALAAVDAGHTAYPGIDLTMLAANANQALTRTMLGQLNEAIALAQVVLARAEGRGWGSLLQTRPAHLALALAHLIQDDDQACAAALESGLAALLGGEEPPIAVLLHCVQVGAAVTGRQGRSLAVGVRRLSATTQHLRPTPLVTDAVWHTCNHARTATTAQHREVESALTRLEAWTGDRTTGSDNPVRTAGCARSALDRGDTQRAADLARVVADQGDPTNLAELIGSLDSLLVLALAEDRLGHPGAAEAAVLRAVALAAPETVIRPFLTTRGDALVAMLDTIADPQAETPASVSAAHRSFATEVLGRLAAPAAEQLKPAPLHEPLTERELTMLRLLPTMKSNLQIAEDSFLSVNTVKAHLKSLYRKLGVSSRRAAVERGRDLGLIR